MENAPALGLKVPRSVYVAIWRDETNGSGLDSRMDVQRPRSVDKADTLLRTVAESSLFNFHASVVVVNHRVVIVITASPYILLHLCMSVYNIYSATRDYVKFITRNSAVAVIADRTVCSSTIS